MEQYGNTSTFNLESVLKQNIVGSDYYRNACAKLNTWSEVIDAIYEEVDYVEPWLAGNARGPSTAFCLLHRLFALKPTEEEVDATITHEDSVYIRAIGFLYLRYVCNPKQLWEWMGRFCTDQQEIQPSGPNGPTVSLGDFVRDLLLEQYYYETLFPRIPKKVEEDIHAGLRSRGLPTKGKGNGGCGGPDRRGGEDGGARRPASVKASLSVAFGQRAPNRAGTKDARWKDVAAAAGGGGGERRAAAAAGGGSRSRSRSREGGRRNGGLTPERRDARDGRDGGRGEYRDGGGGSRYEGRGRGRGSGGGDSYDRRRGQYEDRERGGGRERERERERSRDRDRDRERERERPDRGYDRARAYDRGSERERDRDRERGDHDRDRRGGDYDSRERGGGRRSRSPVRVAGRDAQDVFRERAGGDGGAATVDIRSRYGDASGKLDLAGSGGSGRFKRSAEEVFRLGGSSYR